jgi:hypothetical protein
MGTSPQFISDDHWRWARWSVIAGLVLILLAGCSRVPADPHGSDLTSGAASEGTPPQLGTSALPDEIDSKEKIELPQAVPELDQKNHSVPLGQIYFDTFQPVNRAVPLPDASPELIQRLRDAIPPLHAPAYENGSKAKWLSPDDLVLGYTAGGRAWAYPLRILNFHEIVNDVLAGEPVLISYCPLCYSGIVYSRKLGGQILTFGNTSALYQSDMVMVDYQTGSYWWQVAGEAIVGPLTGRRLSVLPSQISSWGAWLELYPETAVLSRDTGFQRDYSRDPFLDFQEYLNTGRFAFPVSGAVRDFRLQPGARVLAVHAGSEVQVYPLEGDGPAAYNAEVDGEGVVILIRSPGQGAAFSADIEGKRLHFSAAGDQFVDEGTGSTWSEAGEAVGGPLAGAQLNPLPSKTTFWYAIVAAEPDLQLILPDGGG